MNILSHLEGGGDHVRDALAEEAPKTHVPDYHKVAKQTLDFYLKDPHYTEVYIVSCNNCQNDMCLEILEPAAAEAFSESHHQGRRRITLGFEDAPDGYLLSHRKRLDGVMGYSCLCGNNTILSTHERGLIPQTSNPNAVAHLPTVEPHQLAELRIRMAREGYQPDVETDGVKTRIESFTVERIK